MSVAYLFICCKLIICLSVSLKIRLPNMGCSRAASKFAGPVARINLNITYANIFELLT